MKTYSFKVVLYRHYGDKGLVLGSFASKEAANEFISGIIGVPISRKEEFNFTKLCAGISIE